MIEDSARHHPKPGTEEYSEHVREEIEHYGRLYQEDARRENLMQPVPAAWIEAETRAADLIRQATGADLLGHLIAHLSEPQDGRMLSLGSGPGGIELEIARHVRNAAMVCMDINPDLLHLGRERAHQEDLAVDFVEADLNTVSLPASEFNLVLCHAALHH